MGRGIKRSDGKGNGRGKGIGKSNEMHVNSKEIYITLLPLEGVEESERVKELEVLTIMQVPLLSLEGELRVGVEEEGGKLVGDHL